MTKEEIIQSCSGELNRYFLLSSVELCNGYHNYVHYESCEILNVLSLKGEYRITFGFQPYILATISASLIIHGTQLIRQTKGFDLITITNKGEVKLEAELSEE